MNMDSACRILGMDRGQVSRGCARHSWGGREGLQKQRIIRVLTRLRACERGGEMQCQSLRQRGCGEKSLSHERSQNGL